MRTFHGKGQSPIAQNRERESICRMVTHAWESEWLRASHRPGKPFIKWAGGKGSLLPQLRHYVPVPAVGRTYFEPFLGAGAVFFGLAPDRAVLSDVNRPLIETFSIVKNHASELGTELLRLPARPTRDDYYQLRKSFNLLRASVIGSSLADRVRLAALFVWLNRACYNGLYRVNASGDFNVPFGDPVAPIHFDSARLSTASRVLRRARAELVAGDYELVLRSAVAGDVIYLDPPYAPVSVTASFTDYAAGGFDESEQVRLAEVVKGLVSRGCRVVLSNSSNEFVKDLYREFTTHVVIAPRAISCVGTRRGKVKEIVVVS